MQSKTIRNLRKQSGMTLIELGIVIAIMALIVFAAVQLAAGTQMKNDGVAEVTQLQSAAQTIKKLCRAQGATCTGVTTAIVANNGAFTADRIGGTVAVPTIAHRIGAAGLVTISNVTANTFTLSYTSPDTASACSEFVQSAANIADVITVNAVSVKATGAALDLGATGTNCAGAARAIALTINRL